MSFGDSGLRSIRQSGGERAIVFVHGLGGHPMMSWGAFPALLASDPDLKGWDILTFGYSSGLTLPVVSELLSSELIRTGFRQIALIAHGTGSLAAQRALIDHPELAVRTTHAFFFASPNRGMRFPVPNPLLKAIGFAARFRQLEDVSPSSSFLTELNTKWAETFGRTTPFSYWSIAGAHDTVVLFESLTATPAEHRLVIPGTHVSLIKPTSATEPAVQIVRDGLLKHTVPESAKKDAGSAAVLEKKVEEDLFDVFLHRDSLDSEEVRELALRLNHQGIRTWLLEDASPAGRKWEDVLSQHIEQIRSVAICIGRLGPARIATQREAVAQMFAEKGLPVIPVFLSSSPTDAGELSDTLSAYIPVDFRSSESDALGNLIAGIRGERPQRAVRPPPVTSSSRDRSRRGSGKRWKAITAAVVILITIIVMWKAFQSPGSSIAQQILDARKANTTKPQFLKPLNKKDAPSTPDATLLLFIHGVFGDTVDTWRRNAQTDSLPKLILSEEEFSQGVDVFAFGYTTDMVKLGSFDIPDAATTLASEFDYWQFLTKYKRIVIVAHSMGGLVALEMLSTNPKIRAQVPLVVTFATPYDGSQVAVLGDKVLKNPALTGMLPRDGNNPFLSSLANRWKRSQNDSQLKTMVRCAYENVPLLGIGLVVPKTSASALCNDVADPIADDHLGLIKPDGPEHQSVKILTNALRSLSPSIGAPPKGEPPPLDLGSLMPGCTCTGNQARGSCVCETPGTFVWNRPTTIDAITLTACGGGGGGGQAGGAGHGGSDNAGGGGGGEGAPIFELLLTELSGPQYTVVVGKGGDGGTGTGAIDGKDGEPSSFGAKTASFRSTAKPNSPTTLPFTDYLEFPGGSGGKRGGHASERFAGPGGNGSHGAAGGTGRGPVADYASASENGQPSRFALGGKGSVNCQVVEGSGGSGGGGGGGWGPGGNGGCGGGSGGAKPGGKGGPGAGGGGGGGYGQDNLVGEAGGNGGRGHVIIQWGS